MARMLANNTLAANLCGFSLVEVLVALFLQAFGMLGMTALQIKALKSTQAALIDSQAQYLLTDMAERIRANPAGTYGIAFMDGTPSALKQCELVICSNSELVAWDTRQWRQKIEDADYLPEGEGQVTFNSLTRTYDIAIRYTWSRMATAELIGTKRTVSIAVSIME